MSGAVAAEKMLLMVRIVHAENAVYTPNNLKIPASSSG
jgi:hypothetical protein